VHCGDGSVVVLSGDGPDVAVEDSPLVARGQFRGVQPGLDLIAASDVVVVGADADADADVVAEEPRLVEDALRGELARIERGVARVGVGLEADTVDGPVVERRVTAGWCR
jgi:hypothetical protein